MNIVFVLPVVELAYVEKIFDFDPERPENGIHSWFVLHYLVNFGGDELTMRLTAYGKEQMAQMPHIETITDASAVYQNLPAGPARVALDWSYSHG